jgi:enterochelin esterase family protein
VRFVRVADAITSPAIEALRAGGPLTPAGVDAFLAAHRIPVIEDTRATFLWRGEAESVHLLHMIYGLPTHQPFTRPGQRPLFLTPGAAARSRVEYKIQARAPARRR